MPPQESYTIELDTGDIIFRVFLTASDFLSLVESDLRVLVRLVIMVAERK